MAFRRLINVDCPRSDNDRRRAAHLTAVILGFSLLTSTATVVAHEGPPYPIIVDKPLGPCIASVWGDPDVGVGTFFIILEPGQKGNPLPEEIRVEIAVQPVTGRLDEVRYNAVRDPIRGVVQYKVESNFDSEELWRVRVLLYTSQGNGEIATEVEVTPPGYGKWDLLLYAFPFIVIGVLWLRAVLRGRSRRKLRSEKAA
jgi:hypothetical protein